MRWFEVMVIDLFDSLPISHKGFKWIFILEDIGSRWVEFFPLEIATADSCAKILIDEVFLRYGVPRKVISDNGAQFVSVILHANALFKDVEYVPGMSFHILSVRQMTSKGTKVLFEASKYNIF